MGAQATLRRDLTRRVRPYVFLLHTLKGGGTSSEQTLTNQLGRGLCCIILMVLAFFII
jgi:hypothetical protein